jgi:hypothetical protein
MFRRLLLGLFDDAQKRSRRASSAGILLFGLFLRDRRQDDNVVTFLPIHRRRSPASAGSMSSSLAILSSGSPRHRVIHFVALRLSISAANLPWLLTGSTLSPMILQFRFTNSG